jgi:hypothetical protein
MEMMLSGADIECYDRDGFIVVPDWASLMRPRLTLFEA